MLTDNCGPVEIEALREDRSSGESFVVDTPLTCRLRRLRCRSIGAALSSPVPYAPVGCSGLDVVYPLTYSQYRTSFHIMKRRRGSP
jgi:hypothetical protein